MSDEDDDFILVDDYLGISNLMLEAMERFHLSVEDAVALDDMYWAGQDE